MSDLRSASPVISPHASGNQTSMWSSLARLIRLPNQTGTLLLMLPTLWALVLAFHGRPPLLLLLVFSAGSFFMRSAGVVMNDLADRSFDRHVERTRLRPLASGAVTTRQALFLILFLLICAALLLLLLNPFAIMLSPVAILLAAVYPFAKRIIALPQAMLGIAFGWGVVMAWAAATGQVSITAWLLYAATICWAIAYDTIYALQDREDDLRIGVKSSAILFGNYVGMAVGGLFAAMLILLAVAGWMYHLNAVFYGVLAAIGGFLCAQVFILRQSITPARAFLLFQHHVWVGIAILGGIWVGCL